jgi:hypothetical protein
LFADRVNEHFLAHLLPVGDALLSRAEQDGEIVVAVTSFELLRGIGNLCIGGGDPRATSRDAWSRSGSRGCVPLRSRFLPACNLCQYEDSCDHRSPTT